MVNINKKREPFFNKVPDLMIRTQKVHPIIKNLFYLNIPDIPLAGRLKYFQKNCKSTNTGSKDLVYCGRLRHTICQKAISVSNSCKSKIRQDTNTLSESRDSGYVEERGYRKGVTSPRPVPQQYFPCEKEGWGKPSCNKFEKIKFLYSIQPLQDGGSTSLEGNAAGKRLSLQTRSERCILLHPHKQNVQEVHSVSVAGKPLRVFMPMFWAGTSSIDFHQVNENPYCSPKKDKCQNYSLPGRYAHNGQYSGGGRVRSGQVDLSPAASGICDKFKKITVEPSTTNRVSRTQYRFQKNDSVFTTGQSNSNYQSVLQPTFISPGNSSRTDKLDREAFLHCSSSSPREITISLSTATTNSIHQTKCVISDHNNFNTKLPGRAQMVEGKPNPSQWKVPEGLSTGLDYPNRCIKSRMGGGGLLPGQIDRGSLVSDRARKAHKHFGVEGCEASYIDFYKNRDISHHTFTDRQHDGSKLLIKDGGHPEQRIDRVDKIDMELFNKQTDNDYCRISTKQTKCSSRLGVLSCSELKRMETGPTYFTS